MLGQAYNIYQLSRVLGENTMQKALEIINNIIEQINKFDQKFIFRGENKYYDQVSCSLYRAHKEALESLSDEYKSKAFLQIQDEMVESAKQYSSESNILTADIIAQLQHYGGKTSLIDFTQNLHIALFFACHGIPSNTKRKSSPKHGRLILYPYDPQIYTNLSNDDFEEKKQNEFCFKPQPMNSRIVKQESIFVHSPKGFLENTKTIKIKKEHKPIILAYLKQFHNINEQSIYNDIHGFIANQANYQTATIYHVQGIVHRQKGEFTEAIACYKEAIGLKPNFHEAYNSMGVAYKSLEQYQEAIECYQEAIEIKDDYPAAYNNLGIAYKGLGEYQEAITCYEKALQLKPDYPIAYNNMGNVYLRKFKESEENRDIEFLDQAIACYEKAVELKPNFAEAYSNLASAYWRKIEESGENQDIKLLEQFVNCINKAEYYANKANNPEN